MTDKKKLFSIIMPALNEERNILDAISNTLQAFDDFGLEGEIVVVNDGSTDKTRELVENVIKSNQRIRMISHNTPQGVGTSYWDGIDVARGSIVCMLPGDNENDPWETFRYFNLLEHVDIVIPFVYNREIRSIFRNILSTLYRFIINTTFMVNFNYTNGTVIYRKSILQKLDHRSSGFFYQTDILIRAVKKGYLFAEVPYRLDMRKEGVSKATSYPSLKKVIKGYIRLVKDNYYHRKNVKDVDAFIEGSMTEQRYKASNNHNNSSDETQRKHTL